MTIAEAKRIERAFNQKDIPTEDDIFLYTEAMGFLIDRTKDPVYMMRLGGYYYDEKKFELALKYYEMAEAMGYPEADICLGYVWYYGRTGTRDYEKAFHYYSKAMDAGDLVSTYKVADMYKNGYYVERDYERYKSIIESLYPKVNHAGYLGEPLPEVFTRLACIRSEEGQTAEAIRLYLEAKDFLAQRIRYNPFFGNLNIMKWLIGDLYQLIELPGKGFDLFDLYQVLGQACTVRFEYHGRTYEVSAVDDEDGCAIHFADHWYRTVDDFFARAAIGEQKLTSIYDDLYGFEVAQDE